MRLTLGYFVIFILNVLAHQYASATLSISEHFASSYEEYDTWILDPEHGYGSPYGGFSRSTRARIASLPLHLPNTEDQNPNADALHMEIRDVSGRLFVCRVYHEDELDPDSLNEGLFVYPKLRQDSPSQPTDHDAAGVEEKDPLILSSFAKDANGAGAQTEAIETNGKLLGFSVLDKSLVFRPDEGGVETQTLSQMLRKKNEDEVVKDIDELLEPMAGLCAQTHKGWWSYEWCYKDRVTQFHVEISKTTSSVLVEDVTSLGNYEGRSVFLLDDVNGGDRHNRADIRVNDLAQGRPEVARVEDLYLHGTVCPGTNKKRQSFVHLVCCNKVTMQTTMGLVHRDNVHVTTDIMSIYDVSESKTNICSYNVTVCTPLLCEDENRQMGKDLSSRGAPGSSALRNKGSTSTQQKENESVMEILDRTMSGFCLQTQTGGWWTYEICHKKNVRQYHEVIGPRRNKDGAVYTARTVEADHNLGNYQPSLFDAIVPEDEWKFVVNATDKKGAAKKQYFELEYVGGDVCDHSDVTDAAIVAGGAAAQKGLSRASSVRYQCGESYDIAVSEDSTCHYIVTIELPDLCNHPFFKKPVSKKQIFKCIHMPEGEIPGAF